jgi:4-hydroxy-2-oxoheptanedioate aldolase
MKPAPIPPNALTRLRQRQPVFGVMQTLPSSAVAEAAIASGFDFVMLDCEQGVIDDDVHLASLELIAASTAFSAVRVRRNDVGAVRRYLAAGADAILMADVRDGAGAGALAACKQTRRDGAGSLLFAMIESREGIANVAAIAATPGIDGLVIGPHDLAADLGTPKDFTRAAFTRSVAEVEDAAMRSGLLLGGGAYAGFPLERLLTAGHCLILAGGDTAALRVGLRAQLDAVLANTRQPRT